MIMKASTSAASVQQHFLHFFAAHKPEKDDIHNESAKQPTTHSSMGAVLQVWVSSRVLLKRVLCYLGDLKRDPLFRELPVVVLLFMTTNPHNESSQSQLTESPKELFIESPESLT